MALVEKELQYDANGNTGEKSSFSENWTCILSTSKEDWTDILNAVPEWRYGLEHPTKKGFYVDDIYYSRDADSLTLWEISVSYTDDWPDEPDPRKRPPTFTLQSITHRYSDLMDYDGKPFINTAGDFLEDIPEKEIKAWRLTIKKNIPKNWPDWILLFNEAVNKSAVKVAGLKWPKETLRIDDLSIGDLEEENGIAYLPLQMVINYHPKRWAVQSINRGPQERYPVFEGDFFNGGVNLTWKKRRVLNSKGEPVDGPVFLDKNGTAIREVKAQTAEPGVFEYSGELKSKFDPKGNEIVILENWNNPRKEFKDLPILSK